MKTIFIQESKIQLTVILLFLLTIIIAIMSEKDFFAFASISEFFIIAIIQYSFNIIKFKSKEYQNTDARKIYVFISTYVVVGFLSWVICLILPFKYSLNLKNLFELLCFSWTILSPVLIILSLCISSFDYNSKNMKE